MELKISKPARECIKNKLSELQVAGGLLINFVEYKSCCGAFVQVSNAVVVDIEKLGTKVVPVAYGNEGITAYIEGDSDFFETDYTIIRVYTKDNKDCDLLSVQFE
jgi:hypothetical protein